MYVYVYFTPPQILILYEKEEKKPFPPSLQYTVNRFPPMSINICILNILISDHVPLYRYAIN